MLLRLLLQCLGAAVPVVEDLGGDDAVTAGGDDVGQGHQRVPSFLQSTTLVIWGFLGRLYKEF